MFSERYIEKSTQSSGHGGTESKNKCSFTSICRIFAHSESSVYFIIIILLSNAGLSLPRKSQRRQRKREVKRLNPLPFAGSVHVSIMAMDSLESFDLFCFIFLLETVGNALFYPLAHYFLSFFPFNFFLDNFQILTILQRISFIDWKVKYCHRRIVCDAVRMSWPLCGFCWIITDLHNGHWILYWIRISYLCQLPCSLCSVALQFAFLKFEDAAGDHFRTRLGSCPQCSGAHRRLPFFPL